MSDIEQEIIRGILKGENYNQIAARTNYAYRTVKDYASNIFRDLTQSWRCNQIRLANFTNIVQQIYLTHQNLAPSQPTIYVKREPVETRACSVNSEPGSLIRIKAPQKMGKTLLLRYILEDAKNKGFKTVICDFGLFDTSTYGSYTLLLKRFFSKVIRRLQIQLNEDETRQLTNINESDIVIEFFEDRILPRIPRNLVLALENFDNVLEKNNPRIFTVSYETLIFSFQL